MAKDDFIHGTSTEEPSVLESFGAHFVLVLAVAFSLYPVLWVVSRAFSGAQPAAGELFPLPHQPTLSHLEAVVLAKQGSTWLFGRQLANSLVVSAATAAVGVIIAVPTAYALARFQFLGKDRGVRALLATQMFPTVASAIPLYLILNALHLLNTRTGLVVCYASTSVPFAIFQLRAAFEAIPVDLEEAAMVDGDSRFTAFRRIVLPLARPGMVATAIFGVVVTFNEFLFALALTATPRAMTMPRGTATLIGRIDTDWASMSAAGVVGALPIVIFALLVQRHLVRGLTLGAVK